MKKTICFRTKYGWINASEEDNIITVIAFGKINNKGSSSSLNLFKKQMKEYLKGKKVSWNFKYKVNGSVAQKKIWSELKKIPYGKTRSYGYIAKKLNTSPRYVGKVCGQNKHLIVIPCHRVIRNDGTLGGFSSIGGLSLKQQLLELEK
tara:strand:- start:878 stop:1321 length:444 start_codon:yes stop_codon:yes gene_type:complete